MPNVARDRPVYVGAVSTVGANSEPGVLHTHCPSAAGLPSVVRDSQCSFPRKGSMCAYADSQYQDIPIGAGLVNSNSSNSRSGCTGTMPSAESIRVLFSTSRVFLSIFVWRQAYTICTRCNTPPFSTRESNGAALFRGHARPWQWEQANNVRRRDRCSLPLDRESRATNSYPGVAS